jgi:hypothetical protein
MNYVVKALSNSPFALSGKAEWFQLSTARRYYVTLGVASVMRCFTKECSKNLITSSPEHTCRVSNTDHPKEVTQHAVMNFV